MPAYSRGTIAKAAGMQRRMCKNAPMCQCHYTHFGLFTWCSGHTAAAIVVTTTSILLLFVRRSPSSILILLRQRRHQPVVKTCLIVSCAWKRQRNEADTIAIWVSTFRSKVVWNRYQNPFLLKPTILFECQLSQMNRAYNKKMH